MTDVVYNPAAPGGVALVNVPVSTRRIRWIGDDPRAGGVWGDHQTRAITTTTGAVTLDLEPTQPDTAYWVDLGGVRQYLITVPETGPVQLLNRLIDPVTWQPITTPPPSYYLPRSEASVAPVENSVPVTIPILGLGQALPAVFVPLALDPARTYDLRSYSPVGPLYVDRITQTSQGTPAQPGASVILRTTIALLTVGSGRITISAKPTS